MLRDLVAIVLLFIGPLFLIVFGIVLLVTQPRVEPEPVDALEQMVERAAEPEPVPTTASAMDHLLDGRTAFYAAEQARERGNAAEAERLLNAAISHFERAVTINGNMADAHRSLALALDEAGQTRDAIDHYRAYVILEPEAPDVEMVRALIALREDAGNVTEPPPAEPDVEAPAVAAQIVLKKRLTRKDVLAVVQAGRARVRACLALARERKELRGRVIPVMLSWTVEADGTVSEAKMLKPKKHKNKELGRCVAGVLATWRFPVTEGRTPIKYPLKVRFD